MGEFGETLYTLRKSASGYDDDVVLYSACDLLLVVAPAEKHHWMLNFPKLVLFLITQSDHGRVHYDLLEGAWYIFHRDYRAASVGTRLVQSLRSEIYSIFGQVSTSHSHGCLFEPAC